MTGITVIPPKEKSHRDCPESPEPQPLPYN
jgi:hypothetical protein